MRTARDPLSATWLIALGWVLYGVSFFLPAFENNNVSGAGYEAFLLSLAMTMGLFRGMIFVLPCALACIGNGLMLLSPFSAVAPPGRVGSAVPYMLLAVIPANLAVGVLNLLNLMNLHDRWGPMRLQWGFWLWNVSYPIVAVGLLRRRDARRIVTPSPSSRPAARPARGSAPGRRVEPGLPG